MHHVGCLLVHLCVTDGVPERNSVASKLSSREFDPLQEQARLKRNHSGETVGSGNIKEEAQPEGNEVQAVNAINCLSCLHHPKNALVPSYA
jgi:hypothetical protein